MDVMKFFKRWWGLVLIAVLATLIYLEVFTLPASVPFALIIFVVGGSWILSSYLNQRDETYEQNTIQAATNVVDSVEELNRTFSTRKNVEWTESDRVVEYDAHGTRANVVRRLVFKMDGQDYLGKVDPKMKGLDSVVYVGKHASIFSPSIVDSNANLEKDRAEARQRMELIHRRTAPTKKTKSPPPASSGDDEIDLGPGVEVKDFTKKA